MRTAKITAVVVTAATLLYAEDFTFTQSGIGPLKVHTTLTYEGKGERLVATASNESGISIPYAKFCVTADIKGCLFELWTTEQWDAGKTLTFDVTTARHIPNLSHQVTLTALNAPAQPPPVSKVEAPKVVEPSQPQPQTKPIPPTPQTDTQLLTNASILKLAKAGLSEEVIIGMINSQPGQYSAGADAIIALKQSGVSDKVIATILSRTTTPTAQVPAPETAGLRSTFNPRPTVLVAGEPLILHDATPVKLRLSRNLSSADAKTGETVDFEVLEDVEVDGIVVIKRGSVAIGTVTEAEKKKRMARGGKLDVTIDSVRLVTDEKVALRGVKETAGGGHTGGMTAGIVVTALVVWPAAPFFLFMHGKDTIIPKGTEIAAYVNGDVKLDRQKVAARQ